MSKAPTLLDTDELAIDPATVEKLLAGSDFQTPKEVGRYMVSLIPLGARTVFEPTPGKGHLVNLLKGFDVTAPEDFFLIPKESRFDAVVMNPPFSAKYCRLDNAPIDFKNEGLRVGYHILKECMKMSDTVIALMPWFTISDSDTRVRYLKSYGLKSITSLPRRTFKWARVQTCILELCNGYSGRTEFMVYDMLNEKNKPTLFKG